MLFEAGICVVDCLSKGVNCDMSSDCATRGFYGELNKRIIEYLKDVTLEDLMHNPSYLDTSYSV